MKKIVQSHVLELDGIRGIAVSIVVIGHCMHHTLFAVAGVSLFFVLSGFLITRILIGSTGRSYYFSNFYIRRALRIWPLYFLILAIAFWTPLFSFSHAENPAYRYVLYIQNFWSMRAAPPILGPTWSLAIEEQFYLAWPLVVWICRGPKKVLALSILLVALTPLFRVLYQLHGIDPYALTFGRLDGLAMGAALAALSILYPFASRRKAMLLAGCAAVAVAALPLFHYLLPRKAFKDTATNLLFTALIGVAFYWAGSRGTAILRNSVLRFFGKISYCAYLVHLSLIYWFPLPVTLILTVLIATLSFYLFEQPILNLKGRFTRVDPVTAKVLVET